MKLKYASIKPTLFLFIIFISISGVHAQEKYLIHFTDKQNTPYSISNPTEFLSERAILRRQNQNIPITIQDLPVDPAYLDSLRTAGASVIHTTRWFNAATVEADSTALLKILQYSFVKRTDTVAKYKIARKQDEKFEKIPFDTVNFVMPEYGPAFNQIHMVHGEELHNRGYRGEGMLIAVMDAGFKGADTIDILAPLNVRGGIKAIYNFVKRNDSVYIKSGHGTSVLSVMAANKPGTMIGTAPGADYMLFITEDINSELIIEEDNWIAAAEFADSAGADIFNTSLGYTTFDDPQMDHTYTDMDGNTTRISRGADIAASKGILVVNSAGNSGNDSWQFIGAPADGDSVLAVGAVGPDGKRSAFSSTGPSSDGDIKPNIAAQGEGIVVADTKGNIDFSAGTSFSGPLVTGLSACLWQSSLESSNMKIFHTIERSADQFNNPDSLLGFGIPDFHKAFMLLNDFSEKLTDPDQPVIYPVLFRDGIFINYKTENEKEIDVEIYDNLGNLVLANRYISGFKGNIYISLKEAEPLPQGMYHVRLSFAGDQYTYKVIRY